MGGAALIALVHCVDLCMGVSVGVVVIVGVSVWV